MLGIGKTGKVSVPIIDDQGRRKGYRKEDSDLDEASLRQIVDTTGGRYFRADDVGSIQAAFAAIDATQKNQFQTQSYFVTTELFPGVAATAGFLIALAALLRIGRLKSAAPRPADVPIT